MTITARELILRSATEQTVDGVFTAEVKWTLSISFGGLEAYQVLPSSAVEVFQSSLPRDGSPYPGKPFVTCRKTASGTTGQAGVYSYAATYSDKGSGSENSNGQTGSTNEDPRLDSPVIRSNATMMTRAITRDWEDNAILNTAGDPIKASKEDNTIGFSVQVPVAYIPNWLVEARNSVNIAPVTIAGYAVAAKQGRFVLPSSWLSEKKNRNGIDYYTLSYDYLIDERDEHAQFPLNAGFREKVPNVALGSIQKAITLKDGSEPSDPAPLNQDGTVMVNPDPESVIFVRVDRYQQTDHSIIPGIGG